MTWFERYFMMVSRERARIRSVFPELDLDLSSDGATVRGIIRVVGEVGYTTNLVVPSDYPRAVPVLICDQREIPWTLDRHVFPASGEACLCVESEYGRHWPNGSDLTDFLNR